MTNRFLRITFILAGLALLFPVTGSAETPLPVIHEPEGEGVKCVEPEDIMRRDHMNFILHQRDETMHEGIRTRQHSLEECVNCHTAKDEQGEYIPVNAENQFCSSCHTYASVSIDCFQCHATKPERSSTLHKLSGSAVHHSDQALSSSTLQILAAEGKDQ